MMRHLQTCVTEESFPSGQATTISGGDKLAVVGTRLWMGTCMNSCHLCNKPKLFCKGELLGVFWEVERS